MIKQKAFRIQSIDVLRGLVMIIMALDHTRDFFHISANTDDPLNLATTTPILYFTRWITHFCAPVFVFLSGASIYLQGLRKTKSELSAFLIKRGLWLVFVEVIIINFAFSFDFHYSFIILQVIWTIGISMIILGLLIWLPYPVIVITGAVIVLGHNVLDHAEAKQMGGFGFWWSLLHHPSFGEFKIGAGHFLGILYPFLPWTGLMLLGYGIGKLFRPSVNPVERRKVLTFSGIGLIIFFIILRYTNTYGDPFPWTVQKNSFYTFLSFMKVQKYPPSLLYLSITIGPALIVLAVFEKIKNGLTEIFKVYGRVPFFYYVLHFYFIHTLCMILYLTRGHTFQSGLMNQYQFRFVVPGEGYPLWIVYIIWILIVASLYPLCKWFNNYRDKHKKWWLSYL